MKIIDAFVFNNELDLLEIRLTMLNEYVDYFILVESTRTFQNTSKPLYFDINKARFSQFLHKIKHIVVDDMPDLDEPFKLEAHQRNAISRGLNDFDADDHIIVSDIDEIPRPSCVKREELTCRLAVFRQKLYYYFVNCECVELHDLPWAAMCKIGDMESPQAIRDEIVMIQAGQLSGIDNRRDDVSFIDNAGWHFSYLGGVEFIKNKLRSFSHVEYNNEEHLDNMKITSAIENGLDLFGRDYHFKFVSLDKSFPKYIRDNKQRYSHLIRSV